MNPAGRLLLARTGAAMAAAAGIFCLAYRTIFFILWRFLFGEEVWPWPAWSLWVLVILPSVLGLAAALFMTMAPVRKAMVGAAAALLALAGLGLLGYAPQVWKLIVTLGFHP